MAWPAGGLASVDAFECTPAPSKHAVCGCYWLFAGAAAGVAACAGWGAAAAAAAFSAARCARTSAARAGAGVGGREA